MHWLMNSPAGFDAVLVIAAVLGAIFYFLPFLLAWSLNSKNLSWMGLANIILGWTVIGWFIVLLWVFFSARHSEFEDGDSVINTLDKKQECA